MQTHRLRWHSVGGWSSPLATFPCDTDLVLYFGSTALLERGEAGPIGELLRHTRSPIVAGCSTAGEILGGEITDDSLVVIGVRFRAARVRAAGCTVEHTEQSETAGAELGRQLSAPDLRHVFVLSDGLRVNGSALTAGLRSALPPGVSVTGGLAGDSTRFQKTLVGLGPHIASDKVVAVGFYGASLHIGSGAAGGWSPFGPLRIVTRSRGNVLYSLDDQPALALYQRYLGERAAGLPGTGLLFPLQITPENPGEQGLIRTMLAINEADQSITFAGDIPEGRHARLMRATRDALIDSTELAVVRAAADDLDGAEDPAAQPPGPHSLALVVSCVGRRSVLGQRCEEELELALRPLPPGVVAAGFYSYGEIAPSGVRLRCDLHNQTLVLTLLSELD